MYIIELYFKIKDKIVDYCINKKSKKDKQTQEEEKCEHLFLPIDSTGRILACSKCGKIYKLKKDETNPFSDT